MNRQKNVSCLRSVLLEPAKLRMAPFPLRLFQGFPTAQQGHRVVPDALKGRILPSAGSAAVVKFGANSTMHPQTLRACGLLAISAALALNPCDAASGGDVDPEETLLVDAHVHSDGASLINFLSKSSATGIEPWRLEPLIHQLGSADFYEREQATNQLVTLGLPAVSALRLALQDGDKEISNRARLCLREIDQKCDWGVLLAAVRRLRKLQPPGTLEALLHFLPYASSD